MVDRLHPWCLEVSIPIADVIFRLPAIKPEPDALRRAEIALVAQTSIPALGDVVAWRHDLTDRVANALSDCGGSFSGGGAGFGYLDFSFYLEPSQAQEAANRVVSLLVADPVVPDSATVAWGPDEDPDSEIEAGSWQETSVTIGEQRGPRPQAQL
jgi:hypothetical protein